MTPEERGTPALPVFFDILAIMKNVQELNTAMAKRTEAFYKKAFGKGPDKTFCKHIAGPKLKDLLLQFSERISAQKLVYLASL